MVAVAAAHVVTPTQTLSPGVVDIDESSGAIVDIASTRGPVPDLVLAPGFVDIQVNGIDDVDVAHASRRRLDASRRAAHRPRHDDVVPDARHGAAGVLSAHESHRIADDAARGTPRARPSSGPTSRGRSSAARPAPTAES